jgi:uncharacterized damage-inducible protein DinB
MHSTPADEYRRWFEYELGSSPAFQKAVDLMAHLIAARLLWLYRFGVATEPPHRLSAMESAWSAYFAPLDATEVARVFDYRSLEGEWFRNTIGDILTQLVGQIAALVRSLGCDPAVTDFVFWTREPIPEPAA